MLSALIFVSTFLYTIFMAFRQGSVYIFVLYQAYYFFNPPTKWWSAYIPDLRYSFYIVLSLLLITLLKWSSLSENKISKIPQFRFMVFTAFLYFCAQFYAVFPDTHMIALDALITVTILVLVVFKQVNTTKHLDIIMKGYVIFSGYMGYYISQFGRVKNGRFEGAGMVDAPDANGIGAAIAPAIIIALYYFWSRPNILSRALYGVVGIYLGNALVQLGSRGAFLGLVIGGGIFLVFLFFTKARKKHQRKGVIALVVAAILGLIIVTDSAFWSRMSTIKTQDIESAQQKESGSTRVYFWLAAIDMAKDHPFGGGASAFIYYANQYIPSNVDTGKSRNRAVHSTWFEVLTEIGYLGLMSFVGMLYYSFITLKRSARCLSASNRPDELARVIAIGAGLLCFIVSMTFLNRFRAEILYWFVLFTAVVYNLYVLKNSNEDLSK
ncbi:O-antigen ligase family protein [Glaciecola sp. MH2013]|uniref:O-antigen ligase family protein n=1 Tax=Glaciecola sp. MH2013 TaxID=2785524 RepID=UPI0018A02509|nr:O-antigen ligase family protein [Glaciecola sp. MH2013]MBF7072158.1 O-antigen ligase family protein [Glaciecola sp. MH2013]